MKKVYSFIPYLLFILLSISTNLAVTFAADLPGSKDPANIQRYEGTEIIRYEQLKFDQYIVPLGKMKKFDFGTKVAEFENSETLEGQVTRVTYRLPDAQRSSLEVLRNYETFFKSNGWEIAWQASGKAQLGTAFPHLYQSLKDNDQLFCYSDAAEHFLVAKKADEGLTAALFVTKFENGLRRKITVDKGDPILQLDVIQTKKMDEKMVTVTSSEMAKSIESGGRIALYGIYFDFNKADLKPESEPTLVEISKLLKEKSALKLLVVGHTDSVGGFESNRELSQRRAASVVTALTAKYGVSSARLSSFGASYAAPVATNETEDGRAKNRRVELVEVK